MNRYKKSGGRIEVPEVDTFLDEIIAVCKKHNVSISHEDGHGRFEIRTFNDRDVTWLSEADDMRE